MLREIHRSFKPELIPTALLQRNDQLDGQLRTLRVKAFNKDEKTAQGESKSGWKLVILEGDSDFMEALRNTYEDTRFVLGAGHIFIRGGIRKDRPKSYKSSTNQGRPLKTSYPSSGWNNRQGARSGAHHYSRFDRRAERDRSPSHSRSPSVRHPREPRKEYGTRHSDRDSRRSSEQRTKAGSRSESSPSSSSHQSGQSDPQRSRSLLEPTYLQKK